MTFILCVLFALSVMVAFEVGFDYGYKRATDHLKRAMKRDVQC